jgi:hypothetical protein
MHVWHPVYEVYQIYVVMTLFVEETLNLQMLNPKCVKV